MYKLIQLNPSTFAVQVKDTIAVGTKDEAVAYMTEDLGIGADEVRDALTDFDAKNTNCAEYGIFGLFMYSKKIDTSHISASVIARRIVA